MNVQCGKLQVHVVLIIGKQRDVSFSSRGYLFSYHPFSQVTSPFYLKVMV